MKKSIILLLSLLLAACVFFGCQPAGNPADGTDDGTTEAPGPDPATVLGNTEYDLITADPQTGITLIDRAQTNLGNFIADAYRAATGADIAFVTAREIGEGIAKGEITIADVAAALPEEKALVTVTVTGAQLLDALEASYCALPETSFDYMHVSGAYVVLDLNNTVEVGYTEDGAYSGITGDRRVKEILVRENTEIDAQASYTVTFSSGASSHFADILTGAAVEADTVTNREAVTAFIAETYLGSVGKGYESIYGDKRVNTIPKGQTALPDAASMLPQIYITTEENIPRDYIDCTVTVYDPSGVYTDIYDAESTIKIRGNSTSSGAKAPYNIKFSSKVELFGLGKGKKWCLLANMYDKTQFRNKLAYDLAIEAGITYTSSSCFAEVYVNGEYRGMYQIAEPVDVGSTMVDIDIDNHDYLLEVEPFAGYAADFSVVGTTTGIILGLNEPEEPTEDQLKWLKYFISNVELALLGGDYEAVKQYVDVESFAQNYAVQELFKNVDYVQSSTRYHVKDGKLYEGPVWDFDLSSGNCSTSYYPAYNNVNTSGLSHEGIYCVTLFNQDLFRYDEFKALAMEKYLELQPQIVNLYEDNELGKCKIDEFCEKYEDALERNNELWSTETASGIFEHAPVDGTYAAEIEYLKTWLKNRNEYILNYYGLEYTGNQE